MPGAAEPGLPLPPASPAHHGASHHRNSSISSALSEASLVHEGLGGSLYTWGGVNESVAFGSSDKHDSNKVPGVASCAAEQGSHWVFSTCNALTPACALPTLPPPAGLPGPRRGGPVSRAAAAHASGRRAGPPPRWAAWRQQAAGACSACCPAPVWPLLPASRRPPVRSPCTLDFAPAVRHVAAGSHLTVAVTTGGRIFQMGVTGASAPTKHCPWEGAVLPEPVRGQLQGEDGCRHVCTAGCLAEQRVCIVGQPAPAPARSNLPPAELGLPHALPALQASSSMRPRAACTMWWRWAAPRTAARGAPPTARSARRLRGAAAARGSWASGRLRTAPRRWRWRGSRVVASCRCDWAEVAAGQAASFGCCVDLA